MPISRMDVESIFSVGSVIASGGGRKFFRITKILDDRVRIQPTESRTASRLRYDKLSVVIDEFPIIDPNRIEKTVGDILNKHGLKDTQNESYLYGFARAYLNSKVSIPNEYIELELEKSINKSLSDGANERKKRLDKADKIPKVIVTLSTSYKRNPDVIVEVLERAKGSCEKCLKPAPFIRKKDGSPYLEVHHKKQLSFGGEDTVENAIALCPNCHRESHFGENI